MLSFGRGRQTRSSHMWRAIGAILGLSSLVLLFVFYAAPDFAVEGFGCTFWKRGYPPRLEVSWKVVAADERNLAPTRSELAGFRFESFPSGAASSSGRWWLTRTLRFPCWFVTMACACAPSLWLRRRHRQQVLRYRHLHGLCLACGYDLRATYDRCPECGKKTRVHPES
jgi:hypothetical protein